MKKLITLLFAGLLFAGFPKLNAQCASQFYDSFETGSYSPAWTVGSGLTSAAVTTTNPAVGNYRVEGTGGTSTHLTGLTTAIPSTSPASVSWYIFPTGTVSTNYFVVGDNSVTATNCVVFCYWLGSANSIRFVSSISNQYPVTPGQWYHIELRNINWTSHTFDIYINNTLMATSFPFRSATQNSITNVHMYNFNSGVGVWDDILMGNTPISLTNTTTSTTCPGGSDGAIDLSVANGTPGYTYAWSNSSTNQDLSGVTAGTYSVTVTDANTCTQTATITVTSPPSFTVSATSTSVTCNGNVDGTATAISSGGTGAHSYIWSNGGTSNPITGLSAGVYTYTVTDVSGCTISQSVAVTEPSLLVPTSSSTAVLCNGGNADVTVTGSGGTSPYTGEGTFTVTAGNYSYTVTDANGCTGTTSITITEPSVVAPTSSSTTILCNGGNADVTVVGSGGNSPYTGEGLFSVTAGTYTYTVTDVNGCTGSTSITVTEPTAISSSTTQVDVSCFGGNNGSIDLTVSGGTAPYTFDWNSGAFTTEDITGLTAGNYVGLLTDANGCTNGGTITISEPSMLVGTVVSFTNPSTCGGTDGAIDITVTGGTPGYTYLWNNSATTEDISGVGAGSYLNTVTDANGCTTTVGTDLNDPNPPVVTLSLSTSVVCQADGAFTLTGGLPAGGVYSGTAITSGSFNPTAASLGANTVTYSYTDAVTGCSAIATATVTVNACTGIANATIENQFSVIPNPNNGIFMLQLNTTSVVDVLIYDGIGQLVSAKKMQGTIQQEVNIENSGIYSIVVVGVDGQRSVQRVMVNK